MSVRLLRNSYVTRFGELEGVYQCEARDELFDLDSLTKSGAAGSPSVFVITMEGRDDADDLDVDGVTVKRFDFIAVVIAKSHEANTSLSGGDIAMTIAGRVVDELRRGPESAYGLGGLPAASMGNATTSKEKRQGQAIWIVGWNQLAAVADPVTITTVPLNTIHTDYDFNKEPGDPPASPPDAADTVVGLTETP